MNHVTSASVPLKSAAAIRTEARRQRLRARSGDLQAPTPGLAPGAVQGNVAILPRSSPSRTGITCYPSTCMRSGC